MNELTINQKYKMLKEDLKLVDKRNMNPLRRVNLKIYLFLRSLSR